METKDVGQGGMEKSLGGGQGPNWAVEQLAAAAATEYIMHIGYWCESQKERDH
jgi:hypothetical protein